MHVDSFWPETNILATCLEEKAGILGQDATITAIIPARFASTRFPGKPLVEIQGMTMVERVYRQVLKSKLVQRVIVATDDERIAEVVGNFGGTVVLTGSHHISGTDRLAEVVSQNPDINIAVNVQGDEPLIDPDAIDQAIQPLLMDSLVEMATLAGPILNTSTVQSAQVVKVIVDRAGFALYFSRTPLPYYRDDCPFEKRHYLGHVGLYVYRRNCLLKLATLSPTPLELSESLEQLRALENGIQIRVVETTYRSLAVDIPEDIAKINEALTPRTVST